MEFVFESGVVGARAGLDEGLWRRSVDGDGEAFGLLFDRHRDRVFRHASRITDSRQDAEDVLASAFLELWRKRASVRLVDGSVMPWLLATTTNLGRNSARGTRRHQRLLDRLPRGDQHRNGGLEVDFFSVDPRLKTALRRLEKIDAQLLALIALEGYPVTVAADLLGLSESAARNRLHRARTRLREHMSEPQPGAASTTGESR